MVCEAGSPLPLDSYEWLYEQFGPEITSTSARAAPTSARASSRATRSCPSTPARCSAACLGVDAAAYDPEGNPIVGELGELVIRQPMPSMPVGFWNDPDGSRYHASYFEFYPGVWRFGDWVMFTDYGSAIITGRSDATLNRGGVRLGTSELYSIVEEQDACSTASSSISSRRTSCCCSSSSGRGVELDDELETHDEEDDPLRALAAARSDAVIAVPAIPRTMTGKKLELPVKKILTGSSVEEVASRDALVDPDAIEAFAAYAAARAG